MRDEKDEIFIKRFGDLVRLVRSSKNLTQNQVSLESGLSRQYIGYIENGTKSLSFYKLWCLAKGLRMDCHELVREYEKYLNTDNIIKIAAEKSNSAKYIQHTKKKR